MKSLIALILPGSAFASGHVRSARILHENSHAEPTDPRPNIIVVFIDDMG